ncbi:MAG: bifunctional oligoribonuclease/PAP phosphatase NrnA [Saprospiraceae bacterium]|nr:bifunctional oligoribonuclease/PAP phosphatase NrnA [Saprospiraceae bacterium]
MNSIDAILPFLKESRRIIVTTHPNPDADALGSSLAMFHFLRGRGHDVTVVTPTDYPDFLKWMPGNDNVVIYDQCKEKCHQWVAECDIIFCLDFSMLDRLKELGEHVRNTSAKKAVIDHHLDPEDFADFEMLDTKASATAELIFDFILKMEGREEITTEIANCIYAGILTDTGGFKHPSTTAKVHRIVADLIDMGAAANFVNREIYDTNSVNRLRFLGYALLEKLVVRQDLKIAYFVISAKDFERFGLKTGDTEGLVNYALSIKDIVMATVIIEREEEVRLSFRSVGNYAVNLFANDHFEGGGHKNASGGVSHEALEPTISRFESLIDSFKDKYYIKQS